VVALEPTDFSSLVSGERIIVEPSGVVRCTG